MIGYLIFFGLVGYVGAILFGILLTMAVEIIRMIFKGDDKCDT